MKPMEKQIVKVSIQGVAPLIMNRFDDDKDSQSTKLGSRRKKVYDDDEEIKKRQYRTANGVLYQPGEHIELALVKCASNFHYQGKQTYKQLFKSGVFVHPDCIPHNTDKIEIYRHRYVIGTATVMKAMPLLKEWSLDFEIEIIDSEIPAEVVNTILTFAGVRNGLGDGRPKFGRFMITKFQPSEPTSTF